MTSPILFGRAAATTAAALALTLPATMPASAVTPAPSVTSGEHTYPDAEVPARVQTPDLFDDEEGGFSSGDDPAVWVDPADGDASLVVTTAKEGGANVYDLDGALVQHIPARPVNAASGNPGRLNNVDVVQGARLGGRVRDLVILSDRGYDDLRIYEITAESAATGSTLVDVTATHVPTLTVEGPEELTDSHTAYGMAATLDAEGRVQVYVTQEARTKIVQATLVDAGYGSVGYELTGDIRMPSVFPMPDGATWHVCQDPGEQPQFEGLSVDPVTNTLYAGQEDVGLWGIALPLAGDSATSLLDVVRDFGVEDRFDEAADECVPTGVDHGVGGGLIEADVEGVDVYEGGALGRFVMVSSQGDSTFPVYRIDGAAAVTPLGAVTVPLVGGDGIVEGSDGLAFSRGAVGAAFPEGLLVVHDEPAEPTAEGREATRFSYVDVRDLRPVLVDFLAALDEDGDNSTPGHGATQGDIPVTAVVPGTGDTPGGGRPGEGALVLSLADGALALDGARHAGDRLRLSGVLPEVAVTDSRAAAAGWSVTGQSGDLNLTEGGATLRAETLGWEPFVSAGDAAPGAPVETALSGGTGLAVPATLGSASGPARLGTAALSADVALEAPVATTPGSYRGGLTVSLFPVD